MVTVLARILRYIGLILVLGTLAVGPYPQGLFFPHQQYIAESAIALGFLFWSIGLHVEGRRMRFLADWVEFSALALLGCYLLASFTAVYPQGHLNVLLQIFAGLMTFYMLREEAGYWPGIGTLLGWVLVISSIGVVLLGLAPYVGVSPPGDLAEVSRELWGPKLRLSSTLEYPNTYAAYVITLWLVATALGVLTRRKYLILPLVSLVGFLYMLTFFLASSRGAVVMIPPALVLFVWALPKDKRLAGVLLLLAGLLPAVTAMKGVDGNAALSDWYRVYKWLIAGGLASLAGGAGVALFMWLPTSIQRRLMVASLGLLIAIPVGVLVLHGSFATAAQSLLPRKAIRLLDLNMDTKNAVLRFDYYQDAIAISGNHPILGTGGRGWERLYTQYQTYGYVASETHNHFLQVAVEAGYPALIAFLALWGLLFWYAAREESPNAIRRILATGSLSIAIHSLVDFDLSYLSIWLMSFALTGAVMGGVRKSRPFTYQANPVWVSATTFAVLGIAVTHAIGAWYLRVGHDALRANDNAEQALVTAARLMPLAPEPWIGLGDVYIGTPTELTALQRATSLDPLHHEWWNALYVAHWRGDQAEEAYMAARSAWRLNPLKTSYYEAAISAGVTTAVQAIVDGDAERSHQLKGELSQLVVELDSRHERAKPYGKLWPNSVPEYSPPIHLRVGQALALIGRYELALTHLIEARKHSHLMAEAEIWAYLVFEQSGNASAQEALTNRPWIRFLDVNPIRNILR